MQMSERSPDLLSDAWRVVLRHAVMGVKGPRPLDPLDGQDPELFIEGSNPWKPQRRAGTGERNQGRQGATFTNDAHVVRQASHLDQHPLALAILAQERLVLGDRGQWRAGCDPKAPALDQTLNRWRQTDQGAECDTVPLLASAGVGPGAEHRRLTRPTGTLFDKASLLKQPGISEDLLGQGALSGPLEVLNHEFAHVVMFRVLAQRSAGDPELLALLEPGTVVEEAYSAFSDRNDGLNGLDVLKLAYLQRTKAEEQEGFLRPRFTDGYGRSSVVEWFAQAAAAYLAVPGAEPRWPEDDGTLHCRDAAWLRENDRPLHALLRTLFGPSPQEQWTRTTWGTSRSITGCAVFSAPGPESRP
jgi:hypothetical protein